LLLADAKVVFLCIEKHANETPDQLNVIHPFFWLQLDSFQKPFWHFHNILIIPIASILPNDFRNSDKRF
jgi:hypothetical protein